MTGHTVLCPRCGGPLPAHAARQTVTCPFCHVAVAPPPEVIEHVVDRVIVQKVAGEASSLHCPRCATALLQATADGIVLSGCRGCGGLWLDNAAVERLMAARNVDLEQQAARMVGLFSYLPADLQHASIACPRCASPLRRVEVPDTIHCVDVCDAHGTWFDHRELPMFISVFETRRAGELSDEDLQAAGIPGRVGSDVDGDSGFFTDLFRSLKSLT